MTNNSQEEYNLFPHSRYRSTEDALYPEPSSVEDDLFPPYGSPEGDLYPDWRTTKEEWEEIKEFADEQNLEPVEKRRIINYYLDIGKKQKKSK